MWERKERKTKREELKESLKQMRKQRSLLIAERELARRIREEHGWGKTPDEKIREVEIEAALEAANETIRELESELAAMGPEEEDMKPHERLRKKFREILARKKAQKPLT